MANTIKPKRSQTPGATPILAAGEMAVNIYDKKVWVADSAGTPVLIVDGNAVGGGTVTVTSVYGTLTITSSTGGGITNYNLETPQGISSSDAPTFAGLSIAGMTYPGADGGAGQALTTDGLGNLGWTTITGGAISLDDLSDVALNVPLDGQALIYDSVLGEWKNGALTTTEVTEGNNLYHTDARARAALSAGTGISYNSGTGVITNSAPAQTVTLVEGSGITITGAHPTFTIAASGGGGTANISGGAAGNLVYQQATGVTNFVGQAAKNYYVLQGYSAGIAPQWVENLSFFSGGRLTLASGQAIYNHTPSATTIYYTPFNGDKISLIDNGMWRTFKFAELSKSLGTLVANKNYDVFIWSNSGTLTLEVSPWTSDNQRSPSYDLITIDGSSNKVGAYLQIGTYRRYLGTFRTTSTTTTADSETQRFVWNVNNPFQKVLWKGAATSHTYTTATWRNWNNDATLRVEWVTGLQQPQTFHFGSACTSTSTSDVGAAFDGGNPGYDSVNGTGTGFTQIRAGRSYTSAGVAGYHYCQLKEYGGSGTTFLDARLEGSIWC